MAAALAPGRLQSLRALSQQLREPQPREMAEESVFRDLQEILTSASRAIEQSSEDPCGLADLDTCLLLVAECFRCLRNACVECARNQHLMRNLGLISTSVHLIKLLHGMQIKEELLLTALRCSLQFLGNIAAGNGESQNSLWKCAFPDLFLMCLSHSDEKIVAYCCMVLFTCLDSGKVRDLLHPASLAVALHVVRVYREQLEPEWSFLIVTDHLLKCPELVKALYAKLSNQESVTAVKVQALLGDSKGAKGIPDKERLSASWEALNLVHSDLPSPALSGGVTLLELLMATLSEQSSVPCEEEKVFERHAEFLAGCFQEKCGAVLKLTAATDAEDEEALVTIRLLDVLCEMTSNPGQLQCLQALPGLLETAIAKYLWGQNPPQPTDSDSSNGDEEQQPSDFMSELYTLRLTHLAGKQAVNVFTATHAVTGQEEISHPAVGFKSHLIRLIGNLCYKNKENQDKVYELDGIPLILDNCSIDDNNPFVNQWAVFAIRNLTEHNERNQELIAGLEEKGLAESSTLESMGLEMEKREGRVVLRSARKKPS